MKPQLLNAISIISTLITTASLFLVVGTLYWHLQGKSLLDSSNAFFWLASIVLIAHGIQSAIAFIKANSSDLNPLTYGIYTFFAGTAGLFKLSQDSKPTE